ncbi:UNVERIFIED_CONTAM: Peroxisomal membrane protein PMP27 [Siphonaria sp. JEL0065]|nr:Peroxisomal membrane protein PMP27 [Siphonaria sp. JEL0065]
MAVSGLNRQDRIVKFLSTSVGRDRLNRFLQYFARFLVWHLQRTSASKDAVTRAAALMTVIAQTRKIMQTGRQLEFYQAGMKALTLSDPILKATTVLKCIFMSAWLSYDTCQWIHTIGLNKFDSIKDINTNAFKCWLFALVFSLVGDLYKLKINTRKIEVEKRNASAGKGEESKKNVKSLNEERGKLWIATVQDAVDLVLPLSGLEYIQVESGIVGLAGAFTSLLGGYSHWASL